MVCPPDGDVVRDMIRESVTAFESGGAGLFLARLPDSACVAGLMGFRRAEIGGTELVCALWPRFWGQGLAAEGCRACLGFATHDRGIADVLAAADAPNAASLRLIERLGFRRLRETPGAFGAIRWFVWWENRDDRLP